MSTNGKCNNCGAMDYSILFKEDLAQANQIVKCNNCGLMYSYPLNIDPDGSYWEASAKTPIFISAFPEMQDQQEKVKARDYISSINHVEKLIPGKGKALEVGASKGNFINLLEKRGWDVTGIEPSPDRAEKAKKIFGYDLIPGRLEDSNLPLNHFDAIFMFHTIEHCLDPITVISILHNYLKPGGILVVETPTYDSVPFKILQHRERSIRCDSHYYFFTKNLLRSMMEKQGFKVLKHDRVGRTLTLERLLWNVSVILRKRPIDKFLAKMNALLHLKNINIYMNVGDMQRIYCQK